MPTLNVFKAKRYVFVAELPDASFKIFQIAFGSDASIFVTFPYLKGCGAAMGVVTMPAGVAVFEQFQVGETFAVSSHLVKYSHHPSGRAHFSLTGKARTTGARQSVPLSQACGHLFTARFQGLRAFDRLEPSERTSRARGLVPFAGHDTGEVKIVGRIFGERELVKRLGGAAGNESYWIAIGTPTGGRIAGVVLWTPFTHKGEGRYLLVTGETSASKHLSGMDEAVSFTGGFDPVDHVEDHSRDSECLMMFAHRMNMSEAELVRPTIDIKPT